MSRPAAGMALFQRKKPPHGALRCAAVPSTGAGVNLSQRPGDFLPARFGNRSLQSAPYTKGRAMNTELTASTKLPTAILPPGLLEPQPDDEVDHEWMEFLSLGLRLESTAPVGHAPWRNTPVLLSY